MGNTIYGELKNHIVGAAEDIYEIKVENAEKTAKALYDSFYNSEDCFNRYENVVFNCAAAHKSRLSYADFLSAYKKRDFDGRKEISLLKQSEEKTFRFLLNEYIINFHPKTLLEKKNLYFDITPKGKFIATKKAGNNSINYDLSASERTLFDFLCFIEINKFHLFVNGIKNLNYKEKPLILINFPDYLDESFDYATFLKEQCPNRKIFVIIAHTEE